MSEEVEELEYVFVEIEALPISSNNQLQNVVLLTTGEANFTNNFLEEVNSPHRYKLLDKIESNVE